MSAKTRQYDAALARLVTEAGARIVERGYDGAGHRTITIDVQRHQRTFHYACTGTSRGHGLRNHQQRLRWLLQEMRALPPAVVEQPKPAPAPPPAAQQAVVPSSPITPKTN